MEDSFFRLLLVVQTQTDSQRQAPSIILRVECDLNFNNQYLGIKLSQSKAANISTFLYRSKISVMSGNLRKTAFLKR